MHWKVKHVANMRDLGGIPVADGRHVVSGRLYRGGHLGKITDRGAMRLKNEFGFGLIVDLRSPSELEEKPDIVPEGVKYTHLPSLTNEQNPAITRRNRMSELKRIMKKEGGAVGHLSDLYRIMVTQPMAIESHRNLLMGMLECENEEGAIYWHCTQGKDRTGVAAAVILMALGANRDEIVGEYLNERWSLKVRNGFLTTLVGVILFNMKAKTNLSALMNAKRPCMEAALDEVEKVYGSYEEFIREGLGITDEQIDRLREMYLE